MHGRDTHRRRARVEVTTREVAARNDGAVVSP
jgi:hypothetical protein